MRENSQPPARDVDENDRRDLDGTVHPREGRLKRVGPARIRGARQARNREGEEEQDENRRPDGSAFVASGTPRHVACQEVDVRIARLTAQSSLLASNVSIPPERTHL